MFEIYNEIIDKPQDRLLNNLIEQAKQEWESTVDSLPQLICLLNFHGKIIRVNRTVERWQLGPVSGVKRQTIHKLLHPNCDNPDCYLITFLSQAWEAVAQGQSAESENEDQFLKRYLHLAVHPISTQTYRKGKATASFAAIIIDDITRRKRLEAEREKLIAELDAFAHTVAHDLQGSLVPIIGFTDVLLRKRNSLSPEQIQEFLGTIARSGRKMTQVIKELLLLASERDKVVEVSPLDMAAVVAEAQLRVQHLIDENQAKITLPVHWPAALGYSPWVEEVWLNYLSNALKYGGHPAQVELGATPITGSRRMIRFWVRDNGPGLQPEDQARLFKPFTRLTQTHEGHGVGLSIVQRIVERLGGQVGVESTGIPGQGCLFFFTLPSAGDVC